jgi:amino acid transporter
MNIQPYQMIGIGLLLFAMLSSRRITQAATEALSDEDRDRLYQLFSSLRKYSVIPIIVVFIGYFAAIGALRSRIEMVNNVFIAILVTYAVIAYGLLMVRIHRSQLPREFVRKYIVGRLIVFAGLLIFAATVLAKQYIAKP